MKKDKDITRREALEKLAKLSVYSAPTVTVLLTAKKSYAQTSQAMDVFNEPVIDIVCMSFIMNFGGISGHDGTWSTFNDTNMDCP